MPVLKQSPRMITSSNYYIFLPQVGALLEKNTLPTVIKQLVIISRGIQTQPIRNRKVVKKTTTYQENDKNIEVGEMKETECIDIR